MKLHHHNLIRTKHNDSQIIFIISPFLFPYGLLYGFLSNLCRYAPVYVLVFGPIRAGDLLVVIICHHETFVIVEASVFVILRGKSPYIFIESRLHTSCQVG